MMRISGIQNSRFKILFALCSLLFALSCTQQDKMFRESRVLMDTYCTITVVGPSGQKAKEAIEVGFDEIKKLDKFLDNFSPDSEVSAVNKFAGIRPVHVSNETLDLMQKTVYISEITEGAFDPTMASVIKLWKFSGRPAAPSIPPQAGIGNARKLVDYKKVRINSAASEIFLEEKGMELDLGGIAKGYAADKAINAIKAKGMKAALVAIAGDIRGYGLSTTGKAWKVGVQDPRPENPNSEKPWEDIFAALNLKDSAISTSGDYQRFFIRDGKRYHHILDPATGCPAESGLISVSVIAPEGYMTDSLATAVFIMGHEKGMKLLESSGLDAILVDSRKRIFITKNLRGKIEVLQKGYETAR
ncbi:MAG: FAD:protein FMN transferase [Nitrospiraceae bacterium]|nr:MAG: FAD:protein FMN transferase [Nitrospiraceae bacterium]